MKTPDLLTGSLFDVALLAAEQGPAGLHGAVAPGALDCGTELAAQMVQTLDAARHHGLTREAVADRMGYYRGARLSVASLNGWCAPSHTDREPNLRQAMAFDAALGRDVLLGLAARKLGGRQVINQADAALLEWAQLHQQAREIAERKKALAATFKTQRLGARP